MSNLLLKLTELDGLQRDKEVENVINNLTDEKVLSVLKSRLVDSIAPRCIGIILNAYSRTNQEKKKLALIRAILEEIPLQAALSAMQVRDLTNAILSDLESLQSGSLVRLVDFCINMMKEKERSKECWKEILPRLLLLLKEKPVVNHCGTDMSGLEYRSQVLKALCNAEWKPENITMIAAMFREVPLAGEELKQVVLKLLDGLDELEAAEVPPFVYQMLRLCGHQHFLLVLMHIQKYFDRGSSTESDFDSIEAVESNGRALSADMRQSESTVLFHVQKCVAQDPQCGRNLSNSLQNLVCTPEILFGNSFLLSAVLMICDVATVREKFLPILVNSFARSVMDQDILNRLSWTNIILAPQNKLETCLKSLIEKTDIQRGVVLEQLVKFCFEVLLNRRSGRSAETILTTASNTLLYIAKKQPDSVSVILELLVINITGGKFEPHLLRCLKRLIGMTQAKLLVKTEFLSMRMVEHLVNMQPAAAEQSVVALIPLLSRSEGLCNNLVVNLRKAINRPLVETKLMAVHGLLTLVQRLKVKKFLANSQATQFSSNNSVSSQVSAEVTYHGIPHTKDMTAMNMELIQILTPALFCQPEVRLRLYEGIHSIPTQENSLGPVVMHMLLKNLAKCKDLNGANVLDLEKCYKEGMDDEVELVEPVGHLVFSLAMVLCSVGNEHCEFNTAREMFDFMQSLTNRMAQLTTADLGYPQDKLVFEEGAKGDTKVLVLTLGMNLCEAVIAYLIRSWADSKEQQAKKVASVFNTYISIKAHLAGCKRQTKKKDPNQTVGGSQMANPRKRSRPAASSSSKEIGGMVLPPVLDLPTICLLLQLLYCDCDWANATQAAILKNKLAFQIWTLNSLVQVMHHYKASSSNGLMEKSSPEFNSFCVIGNILFNCLKKLPEIAKDTPDFALLQVEALSELVNLFFQDNPLMLDPFISTVDNGNADESAANIITKLIKLVPDMIEFLYENDETEASYSKIPRVVITIASRITSLLKETGVDLILNWLQEFAKKSVCSDEAIVKALLELLLSVFALRRRTTGAMRVFAKDISFHLDAIDKERALADVNRASVSMVDKKHVPMFVQVTCAHLRHLLEVANVLLQRLSAERCLQPYQINDQCAKIISCVNGKEKELCQLLDSVMSVVMMLLNVGLEREQGEALLKDVCSIYRTCSSVCKHFSKFCIKGDRPYRQAEFASVVELAGKTLPPLIRDFITHLETEMKKKYKALEGKKKFNAKAAQKMVLRESDSFAKTMLEYEKFSKCVFQLAAKAKDPGLKNQLNLGPSHDFRINYKEVVEKMTRGNEQTENGSESGDGEATEEDEES
ncbi:Fanconi anemia group I protein [Cloeon dipterum]|uniref:Fanconi anemia group I protein n=1 Tax=Cloeon dipterum TaxID=197152 RepID=UPI00321FE5D5